MTKILKEPLMYKKGLDHIPENELIMVTMIGSWVLDKATIDADHRQRWTKQIETFTHPAAREAGMFFLHGKSITSDDAKKIVETIKKWHNDKHEHIKGLRKKHQK
ncbi:MAG TPA: hypothetical protein VJC20_01965 [Candidatus Paceibacterota bacterium]